MLPDETVESAVSFDTPADDWLAALVRDALVGAYGGVEPPAATWLRLRLAVQKHGILRAQKATAAREHVPETEAAIGR